MTLEINAPEAQRKLAAGRAVLIDVREPYEYAAAHAPQAELIPLMQLRSRMEELPPDHEILFICETGNRSLTAAYWARERGLNAASVAGGTSIWRPHGLPVERGL